MSDPSLALKAIPPRIRSGFVLRLPLERFFQQQAHSKLILVEGPPGFGKTVLLAQWRRAAMAAGTAVAWLTLDERDSERSVLEGIALAIRQGTGRPRFALGLGVSHDDAEAGIKAASAILVEWAALPRPLVLMLDDFDRVSDRRAQEALLYLIHNLPDGCRLVVGTRPLHRPPWVVDLESYGKLALVTPKDLAFSFDESYEFLAARFPQYIDSNLFARIHRLTEVWPVGLEMTANRLRKAGTPPGALLPEFEGAFAASALFMEMAAGELTAELHRFLTDIAILDQFCRPLCSAILDDPQDMRAIEQLVSLSALVVEGEGGEWLRMHQLALDHFRSLAARLPPERQQTLHARAARWFAEQGYWDEAARHALAAGDQALVIDCAKKGLLSMLRAGKLDVVADWLARLPDHEVMQSIDLRLSVARSFAVAGSGEKSLALVRDLPAHPQEEIRFKAALVSGSAAVHADDPDAAARYIAPWPTQPPLQDSAWKLPYHSMRRWLAETSGQQGPLGGAATWPVSLTRSGEAAFTESVAHHFKAVGYLNEGQPGLAIELLAPVLSWVEGALGWRSGAAVLLANTMAAAACEQGDVVRARHLLAERLDLLDPCVLPGGSALGYLAAATVARSDGQPNRALSLLEAFHHRSAARGLLRNQALALGELVRVHVAAARLPTSEGLLHQLLELARDSALNGSLRQGDITLQALLAQARVAALARQQDREQQVLAQALDLARRMGRRRIELEVRLMAAALCVRRSGHPGSDLADAVSTAGTLGLHGLLAGIDPVLATVVVQDAGVHPAAVSGPQRAWAKAHDAPQPNATALLTPREADVLGLLARGLSNKEIARCLDIGEGTIKCHLKNLFAKLEAPDRRGAVGRARLLGLIKAD